MSADNVVIPMNGRFFRENETRRQLDDLPKPLPCPFCGHQEISVEQVDGPDDEHGAWHRAQCDRCGAEAPGGETMREAAAEWNMRPGDGRANIGQN